MPAAPTLQVAPRVHVYLDTAEMDSPAQVNQIEILQYCSGVLNTPDEQ